MTLTELLAQLEASNAKASGLLTTDQLKSMAASASVDLAVQVPDELALKLRRPLQEVHEEVHGVKSFIIAFLMVSFHSPWPGH